MGIMDQFKEEERLEVRFSTFYDLVKGCTERDFIAHGIKCNTPHKYMREMITGECDKPDENEE